eukprot:UN05155
MEAQQTSPRQQKDSEDIVEYSSTIGSAPNGITKGDTYCSCAPLVENPIHGPDPQDSLYDDRPREDTFCDGRISYSDMAKYRTSTGIDSLANPYSPRRSQLYSELMAQNSNYDSRSQLDNIPQIPEVYEDR